MRAIFLTLVVVNLGLFGVLWFRPAAVDLAPPKSAVPVESGVQRLVLLGELEPEDILPRERIDVSQASGAGAEVAAESAAGLSGDELAVDSRPLCTYVGPFQDMLPAEYLVENLQALDVSAQVRKVEVPGDPNFWVYQSPEPSRKAALRRLHEMQAKNIDSYVIPKGELENGISFGVFSSRARAEERLAVILSLGYEAAVRPIPRTFEEIWVSLGVGEAEKVADERWFELLNREDGLEKRQNFCSPVASGEKFH